MTKKKTTTTTADGASPDEQAIRTAAGIFRPGRFLDREEPPDEQAIRTAAGIDPDAERSLSLARSGRGYGGSAIPAPAEDEDDPFTVPVKGVWMANSTGFGSAAGLLIGSHFATQLGSSGRVVALDLSPATGAVRVTMERQSGGRHTAYLGGAAVLLADAGEAAR